MLRFRNVLESIRDDKTKYLCYLNGNELVEMLLSKELKYNKEIQRGTVTKKVSGETKEDPIVVGKKIEAIMHDMIHDNFYESTLVFNLTSENYSLQKEGNDLIVHGGIDILDGWHRLSALKKLADFTGKFPKEKSGYSGKFPRDYIYPVEITILDEVQAKNKFYQLTLGAKISTSRAEYLNHKDAANEVVRYLMEEGNELYQRVEESKNVIPKKSLEKIVTFATLVTALNKNIDFGTLNTIELDQFKRFLNVFFGELLTFGEGFYDEDKRIYESTKSIQYDNFTFHGYVTLAIELWREHKEVRDEEYGDMIKDMQLLKKISFLKDDPLWESVISTRKNKKTGVTISTALNNISTRKDMSTIMVREFKILKEIQEKEKNS